MRKMLKSLARCLLRTLAPERYCALMAARQNRYGQRVMAKLDIPAIAESFVLRYGSVVLGGPFAGMSYVGASVGSSFVPKLIGSYECELDRALAEILSSRYDTVVDVGCAEGFYAVGLAMRLPGRPKVYAFDVDPEAQRLCKNLAVKNKVENQVVVRGYCNAKQLGTTLQGRSLIVCDCEGYELDLLDPDAASGLVVADMLVELHDCLRPGITPALLKRFSNSHHIELIDSRDRDPADYPSIQFLSPQEQQLALSEFRHGPMQWAFMRPRTAQNKWAVLSDGGMISRDPGPHPGQEWGV